MKLTPLEPWVLTKIAANAGRLLPSDLESYQLERLRQTIALARQKSRFYSRHLEKAPNNLSRLEDLAKFPFTTAEDLRNQGQQFLCVSQSDIHRVVTLDTSGTTGKPKRIYFTQADQELTIDFFHHGMSTFTHPDDRIMILLPCERPGSVGDLLAIGLTRLGAIPIRYGPPRDPLEALSVMQTHQVDGMVGVPTHVLTMARFWQANPNIYRHKPKQVLLSTDHLPRAIINALESIWECTMYDHYGMTEMGLGGGVECQARSGYHLREADMYFEIIHPETGEAVPEGEIGEVVFTTLTRTGMPLIRYRTGDLTRFIQGQCPCGTILHTMEKISHRLTNQITFRHSQKAGDLNPVLCMADLDEVLFSIPNIVNFSATISSPDGDDQTFKDLLEVKIITIPNEDNDLGYEAHQAVETIPAIQLALQTGALIIKIQVQEFNTTSAGSMAKRRILDQR